MKFQRTVTLNLTIRHDYVTDSIEVTDEHGFVLSNSALKEILGIDVFEDLVRPAHVVKRSDKEIQEYFKGDSFDDFHEA